MRKIVHIGTHKTATTSLQAALYANRESLSRQGLVYPDLTRWSMRQWAGHHMLAKALADDPQTGAALTKEIVADAEAGAKPGDTLLISSEQYFRHNIAESGNDDERTRRENFVRLMRDTFGSDTEMVIVLRRPDSFCESRHQEHIKKTADTRKIASYALDPEIAVGFDYAFQVQLLQKYFAKVHVLIFEQLLLDREAGGPERAFLRAIGLDATFEKPPERLNESLHPYLVEYLRLMNYIRRPEKANMKEFKTLVALQQSGEFGWSQERMTLWSDSDRQSFLDRCKDSTRWLSEAFPHLRLESGEVFPEAVNISPHVAELPIAVFEEILQKSTSSRNAMMTSERDGLPRRAKRDRRKARA